MSDKGSDKLWGGRFSSDVDETMLRFSESTGADSEMTLMYATNGSGAWASSVADTQGNVGEDSAIAVDGSGVAHVAYKSPALGLTNHLKYAKKLSNGWAVETVDGSTTTGYDCSIAVTAGGVAHISYQNLTGTNHDLMYATNAGGGWSVEVVDSSGEVFRVKKLGKSLVVANREGVEKTKSARVLKGLN